MKLAAKITNRLRREVRHGVTYARAVIFKTQPNDRNVLRAWNSNHRQIEECLEEWAYAKPVFLREDLAEDPSNFSVPQGSIAIFGHPCPLKLPELWHRDPLTQQKWPGDVHFTRFSVFHPSQDGVTDIRRLWEVGRFAWAMPWAQAYRRTDDSHHLEAWSCCVSDFIQANPPEWGPHWLNAMEPALRALHWCRQMSVLFAAEHGVKTFVRSEAAPMILHSLLAHGRYIRAHLEWTPFGRTNHYIADLLGLLGIAVFVPQFKESAEWRRLAIQRLQHEIDIQTDVDGFHAEASTAYHHFATEIYLMAAALDKPHQLGFSPHFHSRIRQMLDVDRALRGPEKIDPQIGDDDSGSMHLPAPLTRISDEPPFQSRALRSSGIYILRSPLLACHVACGSNGQQGVGGHAHNDKLSFTLRVGGVPLLVDSGTFCYSANLQERDRFRSTEMHNTIRVDHLEQNLFVDWRKLSDRTRARCTTWKDSPENTLFVGEHSGYQPHRITHRRTFELQKKSHHLTVVDEITGFGAHVYDFYLHLAPRVLREHVRVDGHIVHIPGGTLHLPEGIPVLITESTCSPLYGCKSPSLCLHLHFSRDNSFKLAWEFVAAV